MARSSSQFVWRGLKLTARSKSWTDRFAALTLGVAYMEYGVHVHTAARSLPKLPLLDRLRVLTDARILTGGQLSDLKQIVRERNKWVHEGWCPDGGFDFLAAIDSLHWAWEAMRCAAVTGDIAKMACESARRQPAVRFLGIFGSVARGTALGSDIDLLLLDDGAISGRFRQKSESTRSHWPEDSFAALARTALQETSAEDGSATEHYGSHTASPAVGLLLGEEIGPITELLDLYYVSVAATKQLEGGALLFALAKTGWLDLVILPHPSVHDARVHIRAFQKRQRDPTFLFNIAGDLLEYKDRAFVAPSGDIVDFLRTAC